MLALVVSQVKSCIRLLQVLCVPAQQILVLHWHQCNLSKPLKILHTKVKKLVLDSRSASRGVVRFKLRLFELNLVYVLNGVAIQMLHTNVSARIHASTLVWFVYHIFLHTYILLLPQQLPVAAKEVSSYCLNPP